MMQNNAFCMPPTSLHAPYCRMQQNVQESS